MSMKIGQNYVNYSAVMNYERTGVSFPSRNRLQETEDLQTRRQTLQNQLLLLKSTSDSSSVNTDSVKLIERELDEISSKLKTSAPKRLRFDRFER